MSDTVPECSLLQSELRVPSAWTVGDLARREPWLLSLSTEEAREIAHATARAANRGLTATVFSREEFPLPLLAERMEALVPIIERGRGFAVVRGFPVDRWTEEESRIAMWGIGLHLGRAQPQDKAGTLMHDVRATRGAGVLGTASGRGFHTASELYFHNDGGDAFALLCRKAAPSGGRSRLASAVSAFNRVVRERPDLARVLQQPFPFDARRQNPWDEAVQLVPVFSYFEGRLNVLYKRFYIELSQRLAGAPRLSQAQIEAMDLLDSVLADPDLRLEFKLEPGDLEIASNHDILHARTAYTDHPDPRHKRHLLRMWLTFPGGRSLPRVYERTREFGPTCALRLGAASTTAAG